MSDLGGKSVIVTGAASGIGRATAAAFVAAGAKVIACDRADVSVDGATPMRIDAGDEADVAAAVERACADHGGLDVFFANAGISGGYVGGIFDVDAAAWAEVLRVNLIGPALAIKHAAPRIAERGGGAIICTASVAGLRSGAGPAPYSASKAGVINLVQVAAQQLAGTGVRVNAVLPGLIETGMTQPIYDDARARGSEAAIGKLNPLRRGGEAEEIAAAVLFLASGAASYVNGAALPVDGGLSSSHPTSGRFTVGALRP